MEQGRCCQMRCKWNVAGGFEMDSRQSFIPHDTFSCCRSHKQRHHAVLVKDLQSHTVHGTRLFPQSWHNLVLIDDKTGWPVTLHNDKSVKQQAIYSDGREKQREGYVELDNSLFSKWIKWENSNILKLTRWLRLPCIKRYKVKEKNVCIQFVFLFHYYFSYDHALCSPKNCICC